MATITYRFNDDDAGSAESIRLPVLPQAVAIPECMLALDRAVTLRRGFVVIGLKGLGKTVAFKLALQWFMDTERLRRAKDSRYRLRRVLAFTTVTDSTYREFAITVAKALSRTFSDRVQGRKKSDDEIVNEIVEMCATQRYALIAIDEAETLNNHLLRFLRDLMTKAEARDGERFTDEGIAASGLGMLLVGDDTLEHRVATSAEAGERWAGIVLLKPLTLDAIEQIYSSWFPAFKEHIERVGDDQWRNYLATVVCTSGPASFRRIENHARTYAHTMMRNGRANDLATMPFDRAVFELASREAGWGPGPNGNNPVSAPVRPRKRK
jgi:type II secretory pathway predicted ATPase ExeA